MSFRKIGLAGLLLIGSQAPANITNEENIVGCWRFYKSIYQGQEIPERDPDLMVAYEFDREQRSRLWWKHRRKETFCERRGLYAYEKGVLVDKTTWVNPENSSDCAQDPDMKPGLESRTTARVVDGEFQMDLSLGADVLTYVGRACKPDEQP